MSWRLSLLPMNTQGLEMLRAPHEQRQPVARRASRYDDISLLCNLFRPDYQPGVEPWETQLWLRTSEMSESSL
jgi:hypothetical protein